jgi:hypothetical protein
MSRLPVLCLILLTGCAMAGSPPSAGSRGEITRSDLDRNSINTAYEAVQRLRPQWLRLRGQQTLSGGGDLVVYLDNARMGGRESLQSISVGGVESIQFLDPSAATLRWGTGHGSGAIFISTVPSLN